MGGYPFRSPRHRSEQYFTCSQSRSHFFRHVNGRPHAAQILVGRSDGGRCLGIRLLHGWGAAFNAHRCTKGGAPHWVSAIYTLWEAGSPGT